MQRETKRTPGQAVTEAATVPRYSVGLVREGADPYDGETCNRPEVAVGFIRRHIGESAQERMVAVYVDTRNRPIGWSVVFTGTIQRISCEPRPILQMGLLLNAVGFILAHNHPSGAPSPSTEDLAFTRRVAKAGDVIGGKLVDQIILGDGDRWTSLKQRGGWQS